MEGFYIEYKNEDSRNKKMMIMERPSIPAAKKNRTAIKIPGRDGELMVADGTVDDIVIPVRFNFLTEQDRWSETFRVAKKWITGTGKLIIADDPNFYYKVKIASIEESERLVRRIGRFTANFMCSGFQYEKSGEIKISVIEKIINDYDVSHPVYYITGEGMCTVTVNGKSMTANVGQNITIDTELQIAYRNDAELQNTSVSGNYEDLYLQEGVNKITITNGFTLKIAPMWRCL